MKQGLSLRTSQHLALTPQLQQSIRLLQLSTMELSGEVNQMLDENPFLERSEEESDRESFGLAQADTAISRNDREQESAAYTGVDDNYTSRVSTETASEEPVTTMEEAPSWDGDGSVSLSPDDSEWGGEAKARGNNLSGDDALDATELARSQETLQSFLQRQALSLRLGTEDRAALYFLIESLNDEGYLEDDLTDLARGLAGDDTEQVEDLVHHFTVALGLLQSLEPTGVGARGLAECLRLQLRDAEPSDETRAALAMCQQPMELLAKRDVRRLAHLCGFTEDVIKGAIAVIARLDPKPGRRFVNVERNLIVPDVIVVKSGRGFKVSLNREVMPRLRFHEIYAKAL
jgi:RNA polymerase sigma-54 factor